MTRYKTFPPRWRHIRVPVTSRAHARAAIALYAPCTTLGSTVQRATWTLASVIGPQALPGRSSRWRPPMPSDSWSTLQDQWRRRVGAFDGIAVYQRPQQERRGFAVLLLRGSRTVAFSRVRLRADDAFAREHRVLEELGKAGIDDYWHPAPLGCDGCDGWSALLTTALPPRLHRPVWDADIASLSSALRGPVAAAVPRPAGTPSTWVPMHGDLTPWNIRAQEGRPLIVLDWEDAGWGPPGADAALYDAAVAALRRTAPPPASPEAVEFWRSRIRNRTGPEPELGLARELDNTLRRMLSDG